MCQTCDKLLQVNINWCQWMWIDVNWCQDMSRYVKVCKVFKVLVQGSSCSPHSWSASHPRTTVTSPGPNDPRYHSMLGSPVLHRPVLVTLSLYVTNMSLFHTISYDFFFLHLPSSSHLPPSPHHILPDASIKGPNKLWKHTAGKPDPLSHPRVDIYIHLWIYEALWQWNKELDRIESTR